jgi:hypothetical protein
VFTWPLARIGATQVMGVGLPPPDTFLLIWILRWELHALATAPATLFQGNVLHPTPGILAGSEHLLGLQPVFAPVWAATGNPVLALNAVGFATFVLSGLCMHRLIARWTRSTAAAYAAGSAFAFSQIRYGHLGGSIHLLAVQFLPLVALGVDATLRSGRRRTAILTAIVVVLQSLCSFYLAYVTWMLVAALVATHVLCLGSRRRTAALGTTLLALGGALAVVAVTALPYLAARGGGRLQFDDRDPFWLTVWAAATPTTIARTMAGGVPSTIALCALPLLWLRRRTDRRTAVRLLGLVVAGTVATILAAGPAGYGRLLYRAFDAVVPGFTNIRAPGRFGYLTAFVVAALVGFATAAIVDAVRVRSRLAAGVVAIGLVLASPVRGWFDRPPLAAWTVPTGDAVPAVYRWLADHGGGAPVLDVPVAPATRFLDGAMAMYESTYHWLPILLGHTGYYPIYYLGFLEPLVEQLPEPSTLSLIVRCTGLRWIVVHDGPTARLDAWRALPGVHVIPESFGRETLFEVDVPTADACAARLFSTATTMDGTPLPAAAPLRGGARLDGLASDLVAGGATLARVVLRNDGETPWPCTALTPAHRVEVVLRWRRRDGRPYGNDERRVVVPQDVAPSTETPVGVWIEHPAIAGPYHLRASVHVGDGDAELPLVWEGDVTVRWPAARVGRPPGRPRTPSAPWRGAMVP